MDLSDTYINTDFLKESLHKTWEASFNSYHNNRTKANTEHIVTFTTKFLLSVFYWQAK